MKQIEQNSPKMFETGSMGVDETWGEGKLEGNESKTAVHLIMIPTYFVEPVPDS